MRSRPRAAFVVTVSLLAGAGCGKQTTPSSSECKPPDCHINPPPPTQVPTLVPPTTNPPPVPSDTRDGGAKSAPPDAARAK